MATKTSTPPAPSPAAPPSNTFFSWMRGLGITREPGWIGGVCAGVAARLGIDPIIVRGIAVVVAVLGGPALLLYAAAWLLLPDANNRIHLERMFRGEFYGALAGIGALALLALLPFSQGFWFSGPWFWDGPYWGTTAFRALWTFLVVGSLIWLVIWLATRSRTRGTPMPGQAANFSAVEDGALPAGASGVMSSAQSGAASSISEPPAPPAPPADPDELAAWKQQQTTWRQEHAAWRTQQAESARAISLEQRRIRNEQHSQQREEWATKQRRTRSHPLFSAIAIGAALIAGAVTTLLIGDGGLSWTTIVTGLAVTLGVLGLAIVVNGFSGRRSGGASALAIVVAIALVFSPLLGVTQNASFSTGYTAWSPSLSANSAAGTSVDRVVVNGNVDLDLTEFLPASAMPGTAGSVDLWLVNGELNVSVPGNVTVDFHVNSINGSVIIDGTRLGGGQGYSTEQTIAPPSGKSSGTISLTVWIVNGTVSVDHKTNGN